MNYFDHLNYALGDEDSLPEYLLLPEKCRHVVGIAGSGARLLPLLAKSPKQLTCVDISPLQLALTKLRFEALKTLNYESFLAFLGYKFCSPEERQALFHEIVTAANDKACAFSQLEEFFNKNKWYPIIYLGKFEKTLLTLNKLIKIITQDKMHAIFQCEDIHAQRVFLNSKQFPKFSWKLAIKLLGNATLLNALLYKGAFPKKNIPGSHSAHYNHIFNQIFYNIPIRESFFAQLILTGKLNFHASMLEAEKNIFLDAKSALLHTQINYQLGDITKIISHLDKPFDFLSLSDTATFLPSHLQATLLQKLAQKAEPDALFVLREHLHACRFNKTGYRNLTAQSQQSISQERTKLWTIQVFQYNGYK